MSINGLPITRDHESGRRDFQGESYEGIEFEGAVLTDSDFSRCTFSECTFIDTEFDRSIFSETSFVKTTAKCSSFEDCEFEDARFDQGVLLSTDFHNVVFQRTLMVSLHMVDVFLAGSKWLKCETYRTSFYRSTFGFNEISESQFAANSFHEPLIIGPSCVDFETVRMSCARTISPLFDKTLDRSISDLGVERTGFERWLRTQLRSTQSFFQLLGIPREVIRTYSDHGTLVLGDRGNVFISYSTEDEVFAEALQKYLVSADVATWFAPHDMRGGKPIVDQVFQAISKQERMILILSDSSMASAWVASEVRKAIEVEETSKTQKLFPVRITEFDKIASWSLFDTDRGEDLARRVREYYIPSFMNWQDEAAFASAANKLVSDLTVD